MFPSERTNPPNSGQPVAQDNYTLLDIESSGPQGTKRVIALDVSQAQQVRRAVV